MLRTSGKNFKLFLWYFLRTFEFYKITYWQAPSHVHIQMWTSEPSFVFDFLTCTFHIFLFSSYPFYLVSDCLFSYALIVVLMSIVLCVFPVTLFGSSSACFLTSFSSWYFSWFICLLFLLLTGTAFPLPSQLFFHSLPVPLFSRLFSKLH